MYRFAYKYNEEVIFYFDSAGNKYVATGGNLAWRMAAMENGHLEFKEAKSGYDTDKMTHSCCVLIEVINAH